MNGIEICRMLKVRLSEEQRRAIRYLERGGEQFRVTFGWQNAIEHARAHWNARRRKRYALRRR